MSSNTYVGDRIVSFLGSEVVPFSKKKDFLRFLINATMLVAVSNEKGIPEKDLSALRSLALDCGRGSNVKINTERIKAILRHTLSGKWRSKAIIIAIAADIIVQDFMVSMDFPCLQKAGREIADNLWAAYVGCSPAIVGSLLEITEPSNCLDILFDEANIADSFDDTAFSYQDQTFPKDKMKRKPQPCISEEMS